MKLINRTNRMKVIPLPHHSYCKALCRCVCIQLPGMKGKVALSLTIPAGGTSKELPDAILKVAQVARLIKQRHLEVVRTKPPVAQTPKANAKKRSRKRRKATSVPPKTNPSEDPKTQE